MVIKPIQPHLKQLCKQLGSESSIALWDLEYVITRDFDNGFSVEIPGLTSGSTKKPAQIYLWDLRDDSIHQYGYRSGGYIAAKFIIPQDELADGVEWIRNVTEALLGPDPHCVTQVLIGESKPGWDVPIMPSLKT